jgi:hypothetical protein
VEVGFACRQDPLPDGRVLLTIDFAVRNTGVLPIHPDMAGASYRVGRIPLTSATGFLTRDVAVEGEVEIQCAPHRVGLRLEPKTETIFTAQFLAMPGQLYAVSFTLPSEIPSKDGQPWTWGRWRAVYVPGPRQAEVKDGHPTIGAVQPEMPD